MDDWKRRIALLNQSGQRLTTWIEEEAQRVEKLFLTGGEDYLAENCWFSEEEDSKRNL